ncbi:MAG: replicative DNA helicase [Treponema sp.]
MAIELKDKVPPHNLDAEQAVLGALLLEWGAMSDVVTMLKADRFYSFQNQMIFEAMVSLFKQNVHGDTLTIINELTKLGKIEQAGGTAYIASLTDTVPTAANVSYYVGIVLDAAVRRDLIRMSSELRASSFDETRSSRTLLEDAEKSIFTLSDHNESTQIYEMKDVVSSTIELIDRRYKNNSELTGVPSGIARLDTMTSGFQKSEFIVIGARPSIGKTAFALSMMQTIAVEKHIPCGFFSLEMSYQSIGQRLLAQVSRLPSYKLRSGQLSMADFQKLQDAAGMCYNAPLYIVDTPNMQLIDLRAMARRMKVNQGVQVIFIDYIGLITTENPAAPVYETVSEISKSLKSLARELDIPIVALSQVARDAEGQEPNLAQLRGSGSIEQDADVVLFLHRDRKIMEDKEPVQDAKCIVAKQRNGATGDVMMKFFPTFTKFENSADEQ